MTLPVIRVLIVDDHLIVASGCRALFAEDSDVDILEASDAESGERAFVDEQPDVCVLDINLPGVSGFELARRILARDGSARIIMFSMNDDPIFAARAIEAGVKGYVSKSGDPSHLVDAIHQVSKGGTYLPPALAQNIAFAGPALMHRSAILADELDAGFSHGRGLRQLDRSAGQPPSLACRPSPPQGGRSAALSSADILQRRRLAKADATANLPP